MCHGLPIIATLTVKSWKSKGVLPYFRFFIALNARIFRGEMHIVISEGLIRISVCT